MPTERDGAAGDDAGRDRVERNKALVRRFVAEFQTGHDLGAIDRYLAPDFVDHSAPPGTPRDRSGVKAQFVMYFAALPDLAAHIHDQIADGDTVVTRKTLRGTHRGTLFGVPPTGRTISIEVIDIVRVHDGQLTEHWNQVDQLGLLRQLDIAPPVALA